MVHNIYDFTLAHPDIFNTLSVKDILLVNYTCPQAEKQVKLWTHYNEIAFSLNGERIMDIGNKKFSVTKNKSIFVKKGAFNQYKPEYVGWDVLAFYFSDDFFKEIYREYRQYLTIKKIPQPPKDTIIEIKVNDTIKAFCYSILPYFSKKSSTTQNLLELKFKELLFTIFSEPLNVNLIAYANSIVDGHKTPLWQIMEANYMFNLTIAEFARMTDRSVSAFKREFQSVYNTTPGKWLTNKRLEYAKLLLTTSSKNITEITYDSGFENVSHFSRIFKEKYGSSPIQFRSKN